MLEIFLTFLILLNLLTFLLYAFDKNRARKSKWRIRENVLIFFTLAFGGFGAFLGMFLMRHKTKKLKFKIALIVGLIIAAVPAVHIIHGFTLDRSVRFLEMQFFSESWRKELNGYRIGFITDFHIITDEKMREIVDELNNRNLDLLILGGDFSMRNNHYQGTLNEISRVVTQDGIFGVEGNHDDYRRLFSAKLQNGIVPLDNNGFSIHEGFYVAGVSDMWNRRASINEALLGSYEGDFVLLVSHNPDIVMEMEAERTDLILSGHTHGGQITFFGFPIYLQRGSVTRYGTRFGYGLNASESGTLVFTSRGVGNYYNIPRIFTRPEVVIFTMFNE